MTCQTTRAFLPAMMNNNHGHVVTVASAAGHFVTSYMVAYCSSKFAAVGFHKALTEELSTLGKDGVKTTCLCPVFINTGFVKNPSTRHYVLAPALDLVFQLTVEKQLVPSAKENLQRHFAHMTVAFE
uniref:Estradiol 17-beta-dehydrogenase 11 n=1 Tax=Bubo bubo TaxID=30461 RepID=A0A8C0E5I2_BUBBB